MYLVKKETVNKEIEWYNEGYWFFFNINLSKEKEIMLNHIVENNMIAKVYSITGEIFGWFLLMQ